MIDNLNQYKALIFDLDGTLVNSMPFHILAWQQVAKEHGFELSGDFIKLHSGTSSLVLAQILIDLGKLEGNAQDFVKRKTELYRQNLHKVELFQPILEILQKGHALGLKIAIGTGTQKINALDILNAHNLMPFIDCIVSSDDIQNPKPAPDTFSKCAQILGIESKDCLVFEDGKLGVDAAKAANMDCVFIEEGKIIKLIQA